MRSDHTLANSKFTLSSFVQAKHLLVSLSGETTDFVDQLLDEKGLKRNVHLIIAQVVLAPVCIANSNLIGTLTSRMILNSELRKKLYAVPIPIEAESKKISAMWHQRNQDNPVHQWLRSLLIEVCSKI